MTLPLCGRSAGREVEYVVLSRDTTESDLKQVRRGSGPETVGSCVEGGGEGI